ncbi:MAG: DUF58 domain-containing protein [Alphaproteobacteria bacterium]|nr:DUF58 domain-containing protein [Alphaproteobacteria bacterium]
MSATALQQQRHEAEAWAARLPDLRIQALRVAATVALGSHGRRRPGPGDSFWQFRPYRPGDPVRRIDWRRSARSDRLYFREREWQAAETFWFWLDRSPSMAYRSRPHGPAKQDRAAVLAMAAAALLCRSGERIGVLTAAGARAAGTGQHALDRFLEHLAGAATDTSLPPTARLPRFSTVLAFGDTLAPLDAWDRRIAALSAPGVRGQLVQVVDPGEVRFAYRGRLRIEGLEGEPPELLRRAEDLARVYGERFTAHGRGLEAICQRRGWRFRHHATDQAPLPLLLSLYQTLGLNRRVAHA